MTILLEQQNLLENYNNVLRKFEINLIEKSLQCDQENWTLFYNINLGEIKIYEEILLDIKNDHLLKIEIDNKTIIETSIKDLWNFFINGNTSSYIKLIKNNEKYSICINFNKIEALEIKISQKRRAGNNGKLKISGYIINYLDRN